jgi:hypothetical protein
MDGELGRWLIWSEQDQLVGGVVGTCAEAWSSNKERWLPSCRIELTEHTWASSGDFVGVIKTSSRRGNLGK